MTEVGGKSNWLASLGHQTNITAYIILLPPQKLSLTKIYSIGYLFRLLSYYTAQRWYIFMFCVE